jgi:hypothetical protein
MLGSDSCGVLQKRPILGGPRRSILAFKSFSERKAHCFPSVYSAEPSSKLTTAK